MTRPEIRPATHADIARFDGTKPPMSWRGHVALIDGEPIALWGVYYDTGYVIAFSQMTERARAYKIEIVRQAKRFIQSLGNRRVKAVCDPQIPGADRFLRYLGFGFSHACDHGKVFELGRA